MVLLVLLFPFCWEFNYQRQHFGNKREEIITEEKKLNFHDFIWSKSSLSVDLKSDRVVPEIEPSFSWQRVKVRFIGNDLNADDVIIL